LGGTTQAGAYDAWRQNTTHDLIPEIVGLTGFAQFVSETPTQPKKPAPAQPAI